MFEHVIQQAREMITRFERTASEGDKTPTSIKVTNLEFDHWNAGVERLVGEAFGMNSKHLKTWREHADPDRQRELSRRIFEESRERWGIDDWYGGSIHYLRASITLLSEFEASLSMAGSRQRTGQVKKLEGLIELPQTEQQLAGATPDTAKSSLGHRIFLVHGHDERVLHEVARFLERLKQEVIVLREQPSAGRTIIEKFVDYSDVGYAVVLLTPDDRGATANTPFEQQQGRARQNVIFELGYFIGKLGRNRVTALYMPGVEVPSDYSGVAFVAFDDRGAWRLELARELKAARLSVDINLVL